MEKELAVPAHWKKIDEKDYKMLGIVNSTHIGCPGAFSIKEENNSYIVVYNDYSKHNLDFIKYLDKQLDELNKLNEDIDGDPSSRDYEDTSTVKNLYHGYINKERGMFYLNVNKVLLDNKFSYAFQMFTQGKNGIYSVQSNINELDELNIEKTIDDIPHIKSAIIALIKLANG